MSIATVTIYRCIGKVSGRVTYRIAVVAYDHADAIRTCRQWENEKHNLRGKVDHWEVQVQSTLLGPLYVETELM